MSKGESEQGLGLPVGWGWREQVGARILEGPGHMGALHLARAHFAGDWQAGDEKSIAVPNRGETLLAAAQREAEAALWRCDGFGVGEVRGARMMLGQQPTIVGADRLFCLMDLPGLWRVIRVPLNSEAIVEVDAVRAPVAPIRIAVGAPDPLGLGVGEHDAPGGEAPCSCGAWHREAVAEPAPLPAGISTLAAMRERHVRGESTTEDDAKIARAWASIARIRDDGSSPDDEPAPREPPAPTDDPGDELPWQSAPDRAAWLMLPVSLVGDETISGPRYNELASVARGLHIRVAELEAANEGLAQIVNARVASPPPGTVAALLAKVEEARHVARSTAASCIAGSVMAYRYDGERDAYEEAARLITATLGAPTPLDRAMAEVCALLPREYPDGATEATRTASSKAALAALDVEEGDIIGARAQMVDAMADLLGALLACDAPATKEPG